MFKRLSKASELRELAEEVGDTDTFAIDKVLAEESGSEGDDSDDDDSDSDGDDDDEDKDEDEDESEDEGSEDDEEDAVDEATELNVRNALEAPIHIDPEARTQIFRCVVCPIVTLKNDAAVDVHLASKTHRRRHARFAAFVANEAATEGEGIYELDPRTVVAYMEDKRVEEEKEVQTNAQSRKRPAPDYVPRVERRKARRAVRREARAAARTQSAT